MGTWDSIPGMLDIELLCETVTFLNETAVSRSILLALYKGIDSHTLSHSAALVC